MICDVHAHYTPKNFSKFMGDRFASPVHLPVKRGMALHPFSDSPEDIEGRFRLMDEAGVKKQILSPNHPPYLPDEAECVTAVKMLNDAYSEFASRYPDRISSYVMLPLPHIDAALKEMERGFDQLGCVGVNMNIICLGRSIAETEFEPIYAEMNRRHAVLFVHPAGTGICSPYAGFVPPLQNCPTNLPVRSCSPCFPVCWSSTTCSRPTRAKAPERCGTCSRTTS